MNYYGISRSNYFQVKDRVAFAQFCEDFHLTMIVEDTNDTVERLGFLNEQDGIPTEIEDPQTQEYESVNFFGELSRHLCDGQVAVLMETGHEGMRYLMGWPVQ